MKPDVFNPRPRASLAPFVGVALAALTVGALVTFSVVAQRASLEGFSNRGVTAEGPIAASPESIVVPAAPATPSSPSGADASGPAPTPSAAATTLLVNLPGPQAPAAVAGPSAAEGRDPEAPRNEPAGDLPSGPLAASVSDDGSSHAPQAHDSHKPKKVEPSGPGNAGTSRSSDGGGRPGHAGRPSSTPKPARAGKPQHTPVAKGHLKAKGRGHHKDRGRGHDKDRALAQ